MKDLLRRRFSFVLNQFTDLKLLPGRVPSYVLLFDSSTAAQDIAFMLGGQWDGCNGVVMPFYDEVSVNTAAKLYGVSLCKSGDTKTKKNKKKPEKQNRKKPQKKEKTKMPT